MMSRAVVLIVAFTVASCGGSAPSPTVASADTSTPAATSANGTTSTGFYSQFYGAQVSIEGATVVLRTTSVPDHPSPYFGAGDARYEAPQAGMLVNPNRIRAQNIVLRVPAAPHLTSPSDTPMGPIGVAVNGVAFFNQYAAGRSPLDAEIQTFDRQNGHPQMTGLYHYHIEPLWLSAQSSSRLLGVLLDGFPVYGTRDTGGVAPRDLDACNGHVGATPEFPQGIYHYHVTAAPPYIAGCFHGEPGTAG
jgi:hypothetical protein